jgi:hypothetical protein
MIVKEFKQTVHTSYFIPPIVFLKSSENSPQNVSAVGASTGVARKPTISDNHQSSSGVIKNDKQVSDRDNSSLDIGNREIDNFSNLLPRGINIFTFINVQFAAVGA